MSHNPALPVTLSAIREHSLFDVSRTGRLSDGAAVRGRTRRLLGTLHELHRETRSRNSFTKSVVVDGTRVSAALVEHLRDGRRLPV